MIGKTVSHYEITGKLGEGGMGVVYEAHDTVLKRKVALKFLPADLTRDEESRKRFVREAQAAAALDHPNICTVHEIGEDDGRTFIVMPCVEGSSLGKRIEDGPLPVDEALEIAIQVGRGLSKAHGGGIVHRDIKPGNILLTEDGHVKIVDFGLAKLGSQTKLTRAGTTMGTVGYMSPEQARGDEVDHRSDIWALGVVLYEMLAGRMPFRGEVDAAVIYSIMNEEPEPLSKACPDAPAELEEIIGAALAKETGERFQSIGEMVAALEAVRGGGSVSIVMARPAGRSRGRVNRRIAAGIIAVAVIAASVLGYVFLRPGQTIESIAVLPIIEHSGGDEEGGFADGFTGFLISELGQINSVRVIGHQSVMQYKDSRKTVSEIADELTVDAVIEGSLVRDGEKVLLTVRLVGTDPERQLWTDNFTRRHKDILALYSEVTQAVAEQLKAVISPEAAAAMVSRPAVDRAAHEAYIKGIYWLNSVVNVGDSGELEKAMGYFNASIEIDSAFARGWAGLAECHIRLSHGPNPHPGAVENALEAVDRALELDDALGEAYFTKGHILWEHVFDQKGAEMAFRKAFELNPSNAYGNIIYAYYLQAIGRIEEGARAARHGSEIDPLSFVITAAAYQPMAIAGWKEEAIAQVRKVKEMFPERIDENSNVSRVYDFCGESGPAIAEMEISRDLKMKELYGIDEAEVERWRRIYLFEFARLNSRAGNVDEAQRLWTEYKGMTDIDTLEAKSSVAAAQYHIYQGDLDRAFMCLEKAYEEKNMWLTRITFIPYFEPLWSDPRYDDLVKRMGLR